MVDRINKLEPMLERNYPISTPVLLAKIDDLNRAWSEFVTQHDRLSVISGRGRLLGLQAYRTELEYWYGDCTEEAKEVLSEEQAKESAPKEDLVNEAALKEEQTMRAVLDNVVMVGGRIAAFEISILAKTEAKADEKVEQNDSSDESSAGEDQPKEAAMENVVFHGQKIGA